jgi:hypothetical protein
MSLFQLIEAVGCIERSASQRCVDEKAWADGLFMRDLAQDMAHVCKGIRCTCDSARSMLPAPSPRVGASARVRGQPSFLRGNSGHIGDKILQGRKVFIEITMVTGSLAVRSAACAREPRPAIDLRRAGPFCPPY